MNKYLQYIAPHHLLSWIANHLAQCQFYPWKTWAIKRYCRLYQVDLNLALLEKSDDYPNLNSFFTRQLKPELRPIVQGDNEIASPVDGCVSQIGIIQKNSLLQAKGFHYSLESLFGGLNEYGNSFIDGSFATLYLSPKDYHRVHMPIAGKLKTTIFIPGRLFSVNQKTVSEIPNVFSRNERLICLFDTAIGPMAVILVGAMMVGSISTIWQPYIKSKKILVQHHENIQLARGQELGRFNLGSTVIALFAKDKTDWAISLKEESILKMGQLLATVQ